jgi:hypothetical protein
MNASQITGTNPTGFVVALRSACTTCGATTAYNYPTGLECVRCSADRTPSTTAWTPGLDKNASYRAAALMNPARVR